MPNKHREFPPGKVSRYLRPEDTRQILLSLLPAASTLFLAVSAAQAQGNTASQAPATQTASTAAEAASAQQQEQQRVISTDPTLARVGGVLTPRGMFALEPSYEYFYAQNTQTIVNGFTIIPGITSVRSISANPHSAVTSARSRPATV
jgi:hypothetical protein